MNMQIVPRPSGHPGATRLSRLGVDPLDVFLDISIDFLFQTTPLIVLFGDGVTNQCLEDMLRVALAERDAAFTTSVVQAFQRRVPGEELKAVLFEMTVAFNAQQEGKADVILLNTYNYLIDKGTDTATTSTLGEIIQSGQPKIKRSLVRLFAHYSTPRDALFHLRAFLAEYRRQQRVLHEVATGGDARARMLVRPHYDDAEFFRMAT